MKNLDFYTGRLGNRLFQYAYLYAQRRKGLIPDIYLQSNEYFKDYEDEIKQMLGEGIGYLGQVGVHIRRGKNPSNPNEPAYHENPFYVNLCDTNYYEQAMAMFPEDDFLVFSDDPEWCKEKFKDNKKVQAMDKGDDVDDLNLLASCKGIIGSNSSYAYWAAFLNPNPNAKIVFPSVKNWYSDGIERTICSKEWIRI